MSNEPITFPPSPFDLGQALLCAKLVETAYQMYQQWHEQGRPKKGDFGWKPVGPPNTHYGEQVWSMEKGLFDRDSEPFGFVSWTDDGSAYLVFRGTESLDDWRHDLEIERKPYPDVSGYGSVHKGFLELYQSMRDNVHAALGGLSDPKRLFITGHSLGCGLSTLAVPDVINNTPYQVSRLPVFQYNMASPRIGDSTFAASYDQNDVPTYRVVNTCDLIPKDYPPVPGYRHVGTPVYFTAQYGSEGANHSETGSYLYALAHPDAPAGPTAKG